MNEPCIHSPKWHRVVVRFVSLALCLLTGCTATEQAVPQNQGQTQPTSTASGALAAVSVPTAPRPDPTSGPTQGQATAVPTLTPRPTTALEATRAAYNTRTARIYSDVRTKYAPYTAVPIHTLGPPEPTPTYVMGLQGCSNLPGYYPQMYGCWRGVVNGQLIGVSGGRQGTEGDQRQGLLMVFADGLFNTTASTTEVYSTPVKIGGVRLMSVQGTLVTLVSYDFPAILYTPTPLVSPTPGPVFLFDLASRQWVTPGPSPVPSLPPTP